MDKIKRTRSSVKGKITRVKTYFDQVTADSTNTSVEELDSKLDLLESAWAEYKEIHNKITELVGDDQVDAEEADYIDNETKFFSVKIGLIKMIKDMGGNSSQQGSSSGRSTPQNVDDNLRSAVHATADIKLPRMDLPSFSGNQLEWQSFRDLFKSIIHNNQRISDSQKLHYLKNSLRDEARALLESIDITDANYAVAWGHLEDRFEDERQLIYCHLKTLFKQANMIVESATQLRQLLDTTTKHLRALKALGLETDHWDPVVVFLVTDRLDPDSRRQWELHSPGKNYPSLGELKTFLEQRCRALEATEVSKSIQHQQHKQGPSSSNQKSVVKTHLSTKSGCPVCKCDHHIYKCTEFGRLTAKEKEELVKKSHLCFNCLRSNHTVKQCKSESTCRQCRGRHHTLLHQGKSTQSSSTDNTATHPTPATDSQIIGTISSNFSNHAKDFQIILSTVVVKVQDAFGNQHSCRALLDSGSQASLITEACVQRLGLQRSRASISISGIGQTGYGNCRGMVNIKMKSNISSFSIDVNALILTKLTGELPNAFINIKHWEHLSNIALADPDFNKPGPIDILIGADVYEDIIRNEKITGSEGLPPTRNTNFGWILSGRVAACRNSNTIATHISTIDISNQLKQFWELEEVGHQHHYTTEEQECEAHFKNTHSRDSIGRFTVALPFKEGSSDKILGVSRDMCVKRLQHVERRLEKCPEHKQKYHSFMEQYLELGHMELIPEDQQPEDPKKTNYLPHHFVLKEDSTTTSFRVVFDASAKTSTGVSLNDRLMVGPKIQEDMYMILLRFRIHRYALTADIAKMYRQIKVTKTDSDFQRILWRKNPSMPIQEYRLNTVTYGTASAPFQAVRTLQQLSEDERNQFPLASKVAVQDFYVDDVMSGCNNLEGALKIQQELIQMCERGGFPLMKWSSNHPSLLESIPQEYRETSVPFAIDADNSIKALGLHWCPSNDFFFFKVKLPSSTQITKRSILSETAQLFDPLAWLAPVVIIAKILFQKLWLLGVSWDDPLPTDITSSWTHFRQQLALVEKIRIPRHIGGNQDATYQIHGFSDSSEQAYVAAVYIRSKNTDGSIHVHLLTSKTKVAPVRQVSLPRLELCGAVLLSKLMDKVTKALKIQIEHSFAWTDSTITLDWINSTPSKWVTFVANRVAEIQTHLPPSCWRHVPGKENPADCPTRGLMPDQLIDFSLWWTGPQWLKSEENHWPKKSTHEETQLEQRQPKLCIIHTKLEWELTSKYSSLNKLKRVTAYCLRFARNARSPLSERRKSHLTPRELQESFLVIIRLTQRNEFSDTISSLEKSTRIPNQLSSFSPFLDEDGILRVGGRIRHSTLSFSRKHPILLPKRHQLTRLLIVNEHLNHLHGGPQLVLASLQQKYWIVNGRSVVREVIHKCIRCVRDRAETLEQRMGDLPQSRLEPSRPFLRVGVDYGGPFMIKSTKGRGGKVTKCYVSLFICMCTKALHLELVTDLTSEAFIATLRRFMARRGKPSDLYSDNGTNFVGADRELRDLVNLIRSQQFNKAISEDLTNLGVCWHFNPSSAPHFGGLWEAGIKSTKRHLRRAIGDQTLTFEEMYTWLTQVEASLNSRPLCSLSSDPSDLTALTPGHFLIGEPLTATPDPDLEHLKINRLSRWQLVQRLNQHFWRRWNNEYLSTLQQRHKWTTTNSNVKIGDLVLLKEDNSPPLKWHMGRIVSLHPGKDGLVRTVTVKTTTGTLKRPIVKLCLLPTDVSNN